jgi:CDP-glucose 4,6-dehydratase
MSQVLKHLEISSVGISLPRNRETRGLIRDISETDFEFFQDLTNYKKTKKLIQKIEPSIVIHMAAQPIVSNSYTSTRETFETNVMGTVNLLEALRDSHKVRCVAVVTTDKVYQNNESGAAFIESDSLGATDPYGASKIGTEAAVMAFQAIYSERDIPIISLRAGNVIGGGDLGIDRIIPDLVRSHTTNNEIFIRNLDGVRPWQHVLDPLYGYLLAVESALEKNKSESFNFGPPESENINVRELIAIFETALDFDEKLRIHASNAVFHEAKTLYLNSMKARKLLNWQPKYTGEEAIISSAIWWKAVLSGESPTEVTKLEVERYFKN